MCVSLVVSFLAVVLLETLESWCLPCGFWLKRQIVLSISGNVSAFGALGHKARMVPKFERSHAAQAFGPLG